MMTRSPGMSIRALNPEAFASECQLAPTKMETDAFCLEPDRIAAQVSGRRRLALPDDARWLSLFVDVHDNLLYWVLAAVGSDFSAAINYGTFPEQRRRYFHLRTARPTLLDKFGPKGRKKSKTDRQLLDEAIAAGLTAFLAEWMERDFGTADDPLQVGVGLIDCGYKPDVVQAVIRASKHRGRLHPSRGVGIGAKKKPFSEYRKTKGDQYGDHWRMPKRVQARKLRVIEIDTNHWKTQVHRAFDRAVGTPGAWSLHGRDPRLHELFSHHLAKSEKPTRMHAPEYGRTIDEWTQIPGAENHWFDGSVGAAAGASKLGATWPAVGPATGERIQDAANPLRSKPGKRIRFRHI